MINMRIITRTPHYVRNILVNQNRFPEIKSTRNPYLAARNRQRNNNRKIVIQRRFSPSQLESTAQKVLSAREHKIADQNNVIHDLKQQIEILKAENKVLKTQSFRQERALNKIETRQSDLPKILDHHQAEVTNLREQLRRSKEALNLEQRLHKDTDNEVQRLKTALAKAQGLVNEKGLGERTVLQSQLNEALEKLETSDTSVKNFQKHLEIQEKTHKREVLSLKKIMKQYVQTNDTLEREVKTLKLNIKEKEKLLEIQNIYSHRIKMPHRLPGSANDQNCIMCISKSEKNADLQKMDFNNYINKENNPDSPRYTHTDNSPSYLDPMKIKDDIRKILEEEISSGRIKQVQTLVDENKSIKSFTVDHGYDESLTCISTENNPQNLDEPITEDLQNTLIEDSVEEQGHILESSVKQRGSKENSETSNMNSNNEIVKPIEQIDLKYSYPNGENPISNDLSANDIETISAGDVRHTSSKIYKFNDVVENLHQGRPAYSNAESGREHQRPMEQKNNNSIDDDSSLPPLTEEERQKKERELMSELFGDSFSPKPIVHGRPYPGGETLKKRTTTNLLWEEELTDQERLVSNALRNKSIVSKSEDIEEIVL